MIELRVKGWWRDKVFRCAERWEELSARQFAGVAQALLTANGEKMALEVKLLRILAGMKRHHILFIKEENILKLLEDHPELTSWVTRDVQLTKQLIPSFRIGWRRYYGPYEFLQNLVNSEFQDVENCLGRWYEHVSGASETSPPGHSTEAERAPLLKTGGEFDGGDDELYRFVAILYRPGKKWYNRKVDKDGDVREPYNVNLVERRAQLFKKHLPIGYVRAILLWYKGCREWMYQQYEDVFKGQTEGETESAQAEAYFSLMRALAEKGTYGRMDEVERLWVYTMLAELRQAKRDAEAMERMRTRTNYRQDEQF